MATQDKKQVLKELLESGKQKGRLTTKEISDALEELDYDVEQVDKLYDTFEAYNIEIVEDDGGESIAPASNEELESVLSADGISIAGCRCFPPRRRSSWPSGCRRAMWPPKSGFPRQICVWWFPLPSGMWAAACSSWI